MHPAIAEGVRLFNSQRFFDAHEALEALWLAEEGEKKLFLHGLIQVAAAFHHQQDGNGKGFRSLLEKGTAKLTRNMQASQGINADAFLKRLDPWLTAARAGEISPSLPLPQIQLSADRSGT